MSLTSIRDGGDYQSELYAAGRHRSCSGKHATCCAYTLSGGKSNEDISPRPDLRRALESRTCMDTVCNGGQRGERSCLWLARKKMRRDAMRLVCVLYRS